MLRCIFFGLTWFEVLQIRKFFHQIKNSFTNERIFHGWKNFFENRSTGQGNNPAMHLCGGLARKWHCLPVPVIVVMVRPLGCFSGLVFEFQKILSFSENSFIRWKNFWGMKEFFRKSIHGAKETSGHASLLVVWLGNDTVRQYQSLWRWVDLVATS